jgi:hypothetical protein
MKVQYQLVDVETKKAIKIGEEFELVGTECLFDKGEWMPWFIAVKFFGDPMAITNPVSILGISPIEAARNALQGKANP